MRAIERLKDLERMQKTNEEKLKSDLEKLDSNKHLKNSLFQMVTYDKNSQQIMRQQKKINDYNTKIKFYEKSFFKT